MDKLNKFDQLADQLEEASKNIFERRDTTREAQVYLNTVAKASENPSAVITAAMVLYNTQLMETAAAIRSITQSIQEEIDQTDTLKGEEETHA